jgi:flagellar biosynthetic protein FlhB
MSASETSKEDRQLPASERRIQQAREEGNIARSRDLVHLASIGGLLVLFFGLGPWFAQQALQIVAGGLRFDRAAAFETSLMVPRLSHIGLIGAGAIAPVLIGMATLLAGTTLAIGGWNFATGALEPKFSRLNPLAGFGRMFGLRQLADHGRLILVTGALLGVAGNYIWTHADAIERLAAMPLGQGLSTGFAWVGGGMAILMGVAFVSALADVPMQIFKHRAELRMTLEEAKQENKESEGDPHIKGERRRRAREMSRGRMMAAVPTADVIVTNPTHYAVALKYDENTMRAPRIVAMGADHLALKIREIAKASKVPTLEAPPLARALYRHGDIDAEVPVELYTAVAQVLAYVFRLRTALRPPQAPVIDVPKGLDPLEARP